MVRAQKFVLQEHFDGFPKETDLNIEDEELPEIDDGEFLAEAIYLSVDPYMRPYSRSLPLGSTFIGSQIAKVIESKNYNYPVGKYILGNFGWRTHTISNGESGAPIILPDFGDLPISLGIGVLGMTGITAYFGFLEICKPKRGETVVVSGAAGAVGSHVGQIAKIKGCTVIGIAGSDEKGRWLVDELGFDHFINYKTSDIEKALSEVAPKGIDCYFDNVGGDISSTIIHQMNHFGRISVCGAISGYNETGQEDVLIQFPLVFRELRMEGFIVSRWNDRRLEAIKQNSEWIERGMLKYKETVTNGFENMFSAFTDMLKGEFLAEAVYLSVDPYMRAYSVRLPLGIPFIGSQVARIMESKNINFPVGRFVLGNFDWRSHTISDGKASKGHLFTQDPYLLPDFGELPVSLALGILGMTGNTAHFGITEVLQPKKGDTVVVSGAAGAVGNIAGQLCKIIGCTVIGIAGSEEKGRWLVQELGFDHSINYKTQNLDDTLRKIAPQGVDCYFDNVGGDVSFSVMNQMNQYGKIAVCGAVSGYNEQDPKIPSLQFPMVSRELKLQGFHVHRWLNRWMEGILQNLQLIKEGKLKYHETVTEGFENMFVAFLNQMKGESVGKPVVKA